MGKISWVQELKEGALTMSVDLRIYPLEALLRVCYLFTEKCYLFLSTSDEASCVTVRFTQKLDCDLAALAGEFSNELINQRVRLDVAKETAPLRELIVAQAFAEADLLDRSPSHAGYLEDPKGIAR